METILSARRGAATQSRAIARSLGPKRALPDVRCGSGTHGITGLQLSKGMPLRTALWRGMRSALLQDRFIGAKGINYLQRLDRLAVPNGFAR